jgi:hypothetical protein
MHKKNLTLILLFALAAALPAAAESGNWQLTGQSTAVLQAKPGFGAAYSGSNSLQGPHEYSRTLTATVYAGYRPWTGGELYFNPEMALGVPFSGLHGLGGFTNGEIARTSGADPVFYRARLFLRQTWGLGGGEETVASAPNQMAGMVDAKRVVLTAGNLSALDIFDANRFSHDPRMGFLNWSLMAQGAWDYPADARGYTWGAALEYIQPVWALRGGRFMLPKDSNGLPLNPRLLSSYGDALEVERAWHLGAHEGRLRLLAFRNQVVMGAFADAVAQSVATGGMPDLSAVRTVHAKTGAGINIEQSLRDDVGLFLRGSANDGRTETYAFTEIDRSLSGGVVIKGAAWHRGEDEIGVAAALNGLSVAHRDYLARGGSGFFLGDGHLNYRQEQVLETYYSLKLTRAAWLSFDYQHVVHPGYNADRGPAHFFGLRLHTEI